MKRERYLGPFSRSALPAWECPGCASGVLKLDKGSLKVEETAKSKSHRSDPDWEPDWIESRFSMTLRCSHCNEPVFVVGDIEHAEAMDEEFGWCLEEALRPRFFVSPISIIPLPDLCPRDIADEIHAASALYWADISASANRIRSAIEKTLDHKKIKRSEKIQSGRNAGKNRRLSLHERIELFKEKDAELADTMLAIKWLGNAGSHASDLNEKDILDAFELMEHVIEKLFVEKLKKIRIITKKINTKKGPVNG